MSNLPFTRLDQIAIEIDTTIDNLGPLLREARDVCRQEKVTFSIWYEDRGLTRMAVYRAMNEDPNKYTETVVNFPKREDPQPEPVEPTHIPEYDLAKAPPEVWTEAAEKVVSSAPPKDRAMVREETLVVIYRALPDLDTAEAFDRVITKCEEHKQALIDVGPAPNTRSELNHTQFPQHGERRHVP